MTALRKRWPALLLLGLTTAYFAPAIFLRGFLFLDVVFTEKIPFWTFAKEELARGSWPLWSHHIYAGFPLVANSHVGLFYPPNLVALMLFPVTWAVNWTTVLHYGLAGLFVYGYLRSVGAERWAAAAGAIAFEWSGFVLLYHVSGSGLATFVWLPAALACLERAEATGDRRWTALASAALGVSMVTGHFQYTIYGFYIAALYIFWVGWRRPLGPSLARAAVRTAVVCGAALAMGAVQLLPTYECTRFAARDALTFGSATGVWGDSLGLSGLFEVLSPRAFGGIYADRFFYPSYVGALTPLLALLALRLWRDRRVAFWLFVVAFGLLNAAGKSTPFYYVTLWIPIPGFHLFQAPQRIMLLFVLGVSILAAFGLGGVERDLRAGGRVRGLRAVLGLATLGFALWGAWMLRDLHVARTGELPASLARIPPDRAPWVLARRGEDLLWFAAFGLAPLGLLAWPRARAALGGRFAPVAAAAIFVNLAWHGRGLMPYAPEKALAGEPPTAAFIRDYSEAPFRLWVYETEDRYWRRIQALWDGWPFAGLEDLGRAAETLETNLPMRYGVETLDGFTSLPLRTFLALRKGSLHVEPLLDPYFPPRVDQDRILRLFGVRYVLTAKDNAEIAARGWTPIYQDDLHRIYEFGEPLPRAFSVERLTRVPSEEALFDRLLDPETDLGGEAFVEAEGEALEFAPVLVASLTDHGGNFFADLDAAGEGYLVVTDAWYPGWKAAIDGRPATIDRADFHFRGVRVPEAGSHVLRMWYDPASLRLGFLLSLAAWTAWLALLLARPPGALPKRR